MSTPSFTSLHTVIIGAGPYGLSLAAHLHEANIPFRIFGRPMQTWATQMPAGMKLKSHGSGSNLSSGKVRFTLEDFCKLTGRPYHATQSPIRLEDFTDYGREFARRFVPNLHPCDVSSVTPENGIFRIETAEGESLLTRNVVLALGLSVFQYLPENLAHLPSDLVTHTTAHRQFYEFTDRDVTVLGRGASSLMAASMLHEVGARVTLITRGNQIHIDGSLLGERSLYRRIRYPATPLGPSLRSWLFCKMPGVLQSLPPELRDVLVYKHLRPAGGWASPGYIEEEFPMLLGWSITAAELMHAPRPGERRIRLLLSDGEGEEREHITSHLIAGTGFRPDMKRLHFLSREIRNRVVCEPGGAPRLSRDFATSVPGLYMIGPIAAPTFGPLLRFAAGSGFAARRVTHHLARQTSGSRRIAKRLAPLPATARAAGDRTA